MKRVAAVVWIMFALVAASAAQYYYWGWPTWAESSLVRQGIAYYQNGDIINAERMFMQAKDARKSDPVPLRCLGDVYYRQQLYKPALMEYQAALKLDRQDIATWLIVADAYGMLKDWKMREMTLYEALTNGPRFMYPWNEQELYIQLAWNYFKQDDYATARDMLTNAIKQFYPVRSSFYAMLAIAYNYTYDYARADDAYRHSLDPQIAAWDYNYALFKLESYEYEDAERLLYVALRKEPQNAAAERQLADVYSQRLDREASYRHLMRALSYESENNRAMRSKMFEATWDHLFGKVDEAEKIIREALNSPERLGHLDFMANDEDDYLMLYSLLAELYRSRMYLERQKIYPPIRLSYLGAPATAVDNEGHEHRVIVRNYQALGEALRAPFMRAYYQYRFRMFMRRADRLQLREAKKLYRKHDRLEVFQDFFLSNMVYYPRVTRFYLQKAEARETALRPHAQAYFDNYRAMSYMYQRRPRKALLFFRLAADEFIDGWENQDLMHNVCFQARIARSLGDMDYYVECVKRAYALNPPCIPMNGLGLPLAVEFRGAWERPARQRAFQRRLLQLLRREGFIIVSVDGRRVYRKTQSDAPYVLTLQSDDDGKMIVLSYRLLNKTEGVTIGLNKIVFGAQARGIQFVDAAVTTAQTIYKDAYFD